MRRPSSSSARWAAALTAVRRRLPRRPAKRQQQNQRARRDSLAIMQSQGLAASAQMQVLTTFERAKLDPARWEEAIGRLGADSLVALAESVEAEENGGRPGTRAAPSLEDVREEEEAPGEGAAAEQGGAAQTFEVEVSLASGNTQQLRSQLFEPRSSSASEAPAAGRPKPRAMKKSGARRAEGLAAARRNSVAIASERGLDALTAAGIVDTLSRHPAARHDMSKTLQSMSSHQLEALAIRTQAGEGVDIVVTLERAGPLGVRFVNGFAGSAPIVAEIFAGSAAAAHRQLVCGCALVAVQGKPVGSDLAGAVLAIRSAARPARLTFAPPLRVAFRAGEPIGIKLHNASNGGPAQVAELRGAAKQAGLARGHVLACVNGRCVIGRDHRDAVQASAAATGPLTLTFLEPGPGADRSATAAGAQNGAEPASRPDACRIRVATFNCGNAPAEAGQLEALVRGKPDGGGREAEADIFVLGLQESVVNTDGDELVKGASKAKQIMKGSVGMKSPLDAFWTDSVARALGEGWALVSLSTLAEMRLLIFARRHVIPEIAELETAQEACGIGGVVGSACHTPLAFGTVCRRLCALTVSAVCRRQGRAVGKIQGARYLSLLHIVSPGRS